MATTGVTWKSFHKQTRLWERFAIWDKTPPHHDKECIVRMKDPPSPRITMSPLHFLEKNAAASHVVVSYLWDESSGIEKTENVYSLKASASDATLIIVHSDCHYAVECATVTFSFRNRRCSGFKTV